MNIWNNSLGYSLILIWNVYNIYYSHFLLINGGVFGSVPDTLLAAFSMHTYDGPLFSLWVTILKIIVENHKIVRVLNSRSDKKRKKMK